MFWGLIMEPHKRYTQIVEKSFHVSMASLDVSTAGSYTGTIQVMMNYENRNYLLCTLQKGTTLQVPLDLNFQEGTKIAFTSNGSGHVHLTGYLVPEEDDFDDELEEEEEDEDDPPQLVEKPSKRKAIDGLNQSSNSIKRPKKDTQEESSDDDEGDDDDDFDSDSDSVEFKDESLDGDNDAEDGAVEDEEEEDNDEEEEEEEEEQVVKPPAKKNKQNKQQQQQQQQQRSKKQEKQKLVNGKDGNQEEKPDKPEKKNKGEQQQANKQEQKKRVIQGGVQVEDLKVGNGASAKSGKFVSVYYIGRLKNGKKFDSCGQGDGFKFRLGKKEVIQGWDIGIAGMKVGGKRRITIPPALAYGAKGSPPVIPPNSQLVFEVELKNVH